VSEPTYKRLQSTAKLNKSVRTKLLKDYLQHYEVVASTNPKLLNQKLPRDVFEGLLNHVGALLIEEAKDLAGRPGPVRDFLEINDLPSSLAEFLPLDFRAFCLALNALKGWISAEQAWTDKYLLRGRARDELRIVTDTCIITGQKLAEAGCELHHPVRDGRPPIPLSPKGHKIVEQQLAKNRSDRKVGSAKESGLTHDDSPNPKLVILYEIRGQNGRSFVNLRRGCLDLMGVSVVHSTPNVGASSRTFARKASEATALSYEAIIALLDEHGLGMMAAP
jgi:hypothetical protein